MRLVELVPEWNQDVEEVAAAMHLNEVRVVRELRVRARAKVREGGLDDVRSRGGHVPSREPADLRLVPGVVEHDRKPRLSHRVLPPVTCLVALDGIRVTGVEPRVDQACGPGAGELARVAVRAVDETCIIAREARFDVGVVERSDGVAVVRQADRYAMVEQEPTIETAPEVE